MPLQVEVPVVKNLLVCLQVAADGHVVYAQLPAVKRAATLQQVIETSRQQVWIHIEDIHQRLLATQLHALRIY